MPRIIHTTDDGEHITDLEFLTGLIEKTATQEGAQAEKSFTVRLGLNLAASIEALSKISGQTRNLLCVELLQFALDEVLTTLKPETIDAFDSSRESLLWDYSVQASEKKGDEK